MSMLAMNTIFKEEARRPYLTSEGAVDWNKVGARFAELKAKKESLGNKHFTPEVRAMALTLPEEKQQRLLDIMVSALTNDDANIGVYSTRPEDSVEFGFYLDPIICEYHKIVGDTRQEHDWNIPVGLYRLVDLDPSLDVVSMRSRVGRNVEGWNLPSSMNEEERVRFEEFMSEEIFTQLPFAGQYYSLTPRHAKEMDGELAEEMRVKHYLFNDMTTDNHLTSSGIASDWPYGRGIWLSEDREKMIWIGEEDHLRIISIVKGTDLGLVDKSLSDLLTAIEKAGVKFAEHETYGVITTCPTNMGTGKRQSVLLNFPNLSKNGSDEANLKNVAKALGLQARGLSGEHSQMNELGTSDISPMARFGVTEAEVTRRLYEGLQKLIAMERGENF